MKKTTISLTIMIILSTIILISCRESDNAVEIQNDDQAALELQGLEETKTLTLAELKAMTPVEGWGGTVSSAGVITPPQRLKGITLLDLAELAGGLEPGMGVSVVAKDGYGMTMSYEQIAKGDFITYDPGTGSENEVEGPLQVIVAYERDGEPIPSEDDGPLRLFIISPKNDNVVDGHWTIKWVNQIRLKPMSEEWSLYLEGTRTELMDRNSFESCYAPGCHQSSWTDEDGNEWRGVPLYYLAGRVDGGNIHEDRAYNEIFAKEGYVLELFAADGYNVSIDSDRTIFNRDLFLASVMNGEPLDEKYFPLRLVGDNLENSEMVGQVAQIVINPNEGVAMPLDEAETGDSDLETQEMVLPDGAALVIFGDVLNKLTLKLENLEKMNPVEFEAEHPQKGLQTYRGIFLNDLLNLASPEDGMTTLVITASDGYAIEVSLSEVQNCVDCLIAIEEDGTLSMVMTGMESNYWCKMVNFLEIR
jgi:DMSO/TMAO reductase YedYZ molybdopterin-dependent catalytic subunit